MKTSLTRIVRSGALFSACLLAGSLEAGETAPHMEAKVEKKEPNPLSFWDGRLIFDLEERVRGEIRENNRDFDSSVDDDNDDAWLLNRFRLGLALKPVSWFKFMRRRRTHARHSRTARTFPECAARKAMTFSICGSSTCNWAT